MSMPKELLPYSTSKSSVIGLVNGVPSADIVAQVLGKHRYVFSFSCGNTTCPISLITSVGGIEIGRVYGPAQTVPIDLSRVLTSDNGLKLLANGADSASVSYTLVYADAPLYVFTPAQISQVQA